MNSAQLITPSDITRSNPVMSVVLTCDSPRIGDGCGAAGVLDGEKNLRDDQLYKYEVSYRVCWLEAAVVSRYKAAMVSVRGEGVMLQNAHTVTYAITHTASEFGWVQGYTGHAPSREERFGKHLDEFGLINMNGRMYCLSREERFGDPVLGLMLSPDNFVSDATSTVAYNRFLYANGNPLKYTDPSGEFITWSIHSKGFSIGVNFTPIGIGGGGGLNFGWADGFSVGVYGEVGYRIGGTVLGAGATVTQSVDYNFKYKTTTTTTTTTSAGVYGSIGPINVGGNVASTYDLTHNEHLGYSWGVSAGIGIGNEKGGVGLFAGYGSGGWNYGLGGYYDPRVKFKEYKVALVAKEDGSFDDDLALSDFMRGKSLTDGKQSSQLSNNPNILEVQNPDGSFTYTLKVPKGHTIIGAQAPEGTYMISHSSVKGKFTFTTLDRAQTMTFLSSKPYPGNYFNFRNFNTYHKRGAGNAQPKYSNIFGNTWFR